MEQYVVSRELAEKLRAAGYDQENSMFMWHSINGSRWHIRNFGHLTPLDMPSAIAAPLSDELQEQLPSGIFVAKGKKYRVWFGKTDNPFEWEESNEFDPIDREALPNALAELWLYCKEQGYLEGGR